MNRKEKETGTLCSNVKIFEMADVKLAPITKSKLLLKCKLRRSELKGHKSLYGNKNRI